MSRRSRLRRKHLKLCQNSSTPSTKTISSLYPNAQNRPQSRPLHPRHRHPCCSHLIARPCSYSYRCVSLNPAVKRGEEAKVARGALPTSTHSAGCSVSNPMHSKTIYFLDTERVEAVEGTQLSEEEVGERASQEWAPAQVLAYPQCTSLLAPFHLQETHVPAYVEVSAPKGTRLSPC